MSMRTPGKAKVALVALALGASTTVVAAPAQAAPEPSGVVTYAAQGGSGSASGSLDNEIGQVGLVLFAGLAISAALAIGAGIQGGAFPLPQIPGLPR